VGNQQLVRDVYDASYRRLVVQLLSISGDQATAEIARQLGIPEGAVKTRLARGRAQLAPLLDDSQETRRV